MRVKLLAWAFGAYAVLSLGSMGTMSIGAAIVLAAVLATSGGPRRFAGEIRTELSRPWSRR